MLTFTLAMGPRRHDSKCNCRKKIDFMVSSFKRYLRCRYFFRFFFSNIDIVMSDIISSLTNKLIFFCSHPLMKRFFSWNMRLIWCIMMTSSSLVVATLILLPDTHIFIYHFFKLLSADIIGRPIISDMLSYLEEIMQNKQCFYLCRP